MGALVLIVLGVVAITALLNTTSEARLSVTLSDNLRLAFGYGSYLVALSILGLGIIVLLPKFGITIRFSWARIIAIEIAFGAFEALLHLFANDPVPRALAADGGGGGYMGWALSAISNILGQFIAILLFTLLLLSSRYP